MTRAKTTRERRPEPSLAAIVGEPVAKALRAVEVRTLRDLRDYGWRQALKMVGERDPKAVTPAVARKLLAASVGKKEPQLTESQIDDAAVAARVFIVKHRAKETGTSFEQEYEAETERQNEELRKMVEEAGLGDFYRAVANGVDPVKAARSIPKKRRR